MRKLLLIITLLVAGSAIQAQQIEITGGTAKFDKDVVSSYSVLLHATGQKLAIKEWTNLLKSHDAKPKSSRGVIKCSVIIESISTDTLHVLSTLKEDKNENTLLTLALEHKDGHIEGENFPLESDATEKFLYDYALETRRLAADKRIKDAENDLKKLESELANQKRQKESMESTISRNKKKIQDGDDWIEQSVIDRTALSSEIDVQTREVSDADGEKELATEKKKLEKMMRQRDSLDKKKDKTLKNIINWKGEIANNERDIVTNEKDQVKQEDLIKEQEKKLETLHDERQNIQ